VIRLALRVRREQAEIALADLLDLAPSGVEEIEHEDQTVEYAVYGAPGELPDLPTLQATVGGALVEISTSEVAEDWAQRWKQFHKPVVVAAPTGSGVPSLRVRPPWEPSLPGEQAAEIVIDPGQAFGTGAHATTKLCLALMLQIAGSAPRGPLVDIGTGSGVLAIAAAKLRYAPVLALDHDPESVRAAAANATANDVRIEVERFDLRRDRLPQMQGATVMANLLRPLLIELADRIATPPAQLVISGLLAGEADEVSEAFRAGCAMQERVRVQEGEWAAVWLTGPDEAPGAGPAAGSDPDAQSSTELA
jgi:ribosomal protein L11 methyltransferase